jgi:hypothetical protein
MTSREFTVDGLSVTCLYENGNRFFPIAVESINIVQNGFYPFIRYNVYIDKTFFNCYNEQVEAEFVVNELKSIFWIK